jgi:hypothetical protein
MRLTTRIALVTVALCAAAGLAAAKPRRVVVLDFDGPKTLAESGRTAVILALGEYDLVAVARWQDAQSNAHDGGGAQGPGVWAKAAKTAGVDAVIDGWVQDKHLTIIVHDAHDGSALDELSIKLGAKGLTDEATKKLRDGLEERLATIQPPVPVKPKYPPIDRRDFGGAKEAGVAKPAETQPAATDGAPATTSPPPVVAAAAPPGEKCLDIFGACPAGKPEAPKPPPAAPLPTPRFRLDVGGGISTRTLHFQADFIENITQYDGVGSKALAVYGEVYPFPLRTGDGQISGPGITLGLYHSVGSTVGIDDEETTGDYNINQNGFIAAVHWRQPLGTIVHLDGEVGYSQDNYIIEDPPEGYEVPDTAYRSLHAGGHVDLTVAPRATVGFGARYFYVLDQGDLTSVAFYGPGKTNGYGLDASFVVPLPKQLFVRGRLAYKRYKSTFDGVGDITEEEDVFDGTDSTVEGQAAIGVEF